MGNNEKIIGKILSDASIEAEEILKNAKQAADEIIKDAEKQAEKELKKYRIFSQAEAEKAASKEISGAEMRAKKMILSQKQALLEETIKEAEKKLMNLSDDEYGATILEMLAKSDIDEKCEVILSSRDYDKLKGSIANAGYNVSEETRNINAGFVIKNGDIEYNYSFEAIMVVQREELEQKAAEILFG